MIRAIYIQVPNQSLALGVILNRKFHLIQALLAWLYFVRIGKMPSGNAIKGIPLVDGTPECVLSHRDAVLLIGGKPSLSLNLVPLGILAAATLV